MTRAFPQFLAVLSAAVGLIIPASGLAEVGPLIAHWQENHPEAALALGDWVKKYPEGAGRLFKWNRHHPLRAHVFVEWLAEHPEEGLDAFVAAHKDWPASGNLLKPQREAIESLIAWARAHPEAAGDLATNERGFAWVGFHVFQKSWIPAEPTAVSAKAARP